MVNLLLETRFQDSEGTLPSYRLGFICALEYCVGLEVGPNPCPFGSENKRAKEWSAGYSDGVLYWIQYSPRSNFKEEKSKDLYSISTLKYRAAQAAPET